jgi:drug/metabolite transporter (DMT)-like permease
MYVVSKWILDAVPPFALITARLVLGAATLALAAAWTGGLRIRRDQVAGVCAVGAVGYGVSLGLQFVGTKMTTAANAALVTSASPIFILLFGAWILRERLTFVRVLALAVASLGLVAILDPRQAQWGSNLAWGNLALLGAALTWGLYSVLIRRSSAGVSTLDLSLFAFLGGLPLAIPIAASEINLQGIGLLPPGAAWGVLYLGIISTALAMYLWNRSLALLEAGVVSLLFFAQPVVGIGLGAWLLGERPAGNFWLGAGLIGAGLLLAAVGSRPSGAAETGHE